MSRGVRRDRLPGSEAPGVVDRLEAGGGPRSWLRGVADCGTGGPARRPIRRACPRPRGVKNPVAVRPLVLGQEAADFGRQVVVAAAGGAEPGLPPGRARSGPRRRKARRSVASAAASWVLPSDDLRKDLIPCPFLPGPRSCQDERQSVVRLGHHLPSGKKKREGLFQHSSLGSLRGQGAAGTRGDVMAAPMLSEPHTLMRGNHSLLAFCRALTSTEVTSSHKVTNSFRSAGDNRSSAAGSRSPARSGSACHLASIFLASSRADGD